MFAFNIGHLRPEGSHLLGDQLPQNLHRVDGAGGVILHCIDKNHLGTRPISQYQPISGSPVMVGGGEALIVQSAAAACCHDYGFGFDRY